MTHRVFNLLYALSQGIDAKVIEDDSEYSPEDKSVVTKDALNYCLSEGLIGMREESEGKNVKDLSSFFLTESGEEALLPYKVDNAVIMAAGRSRRCMPLSNYLPKGLFEIKGETMVERQIKQLYDAGIKDIVIVAGYLKECYHELVDKYKKMGSPINLTVIDNEEWQEKNNLFSLYVARKYLKNTYICCSDNWFLHNVFTPYVYDSYYACKYTDSFLDEYCVKKVDKEGYIQAIKKGGEKSWYTIGEAYFSSTFSEKFVELLENELYAPNLKYMLWDDFQIKHIDVLRLRCVKYDESECKEFDTTEDILQFYPAFHEFIEQYFAEDMEHDAEDRLQYLSNYADTRQYSVVATEQKVGRCHVNENLFGPSPKCLDLLKRIESEDLYLYDLQKEDLLVRAIAETLDISQDNILLSSGSSDVIKSIMSLVLNKKDKVLISDPAWNYYKSVIELKKASPIYYNVLPGESEYYFDLDAILRAGKKYSPRIIVITSPHNPTGAVISPEDLEKVVKECPKSLVILDEAYYGFSSIKYDIKHLLLNYPNIVLVRTFSKLYALAGVRVGYCVCAPMAKQVFSLDLNPFRVCNISRKLCVKALEDGTYYKNLTKRIGAIRKDFIDKLNSIPGIKAYNSSANFVYIRFDNKLINVTSLKGYLNENKILVRMWTEKDRLSMRITLAPEETMERIISLITQFCK